LLFNYLNESDEVFLLNEDNVFFSSTPRLFCKWYNQMWLDVKNGFKSKGYWIPSFIDEDAAWFDVYLGLSDHYRFFGSKIAIGPHGEDYLSNIEANAVPFFTKYFPKARFLLTVRLPSEAILSMKKMFPDSDFGTLKNVWIKSLQLQLSLFVLMKGARFILINQLSAAHLEGISNEVGVSHIVRKSESFCVPNAERESFCPEMTTLTKLFGLNESQLCELLELEELFSKLVAELDVVSGRVKQWVHVQEFARRFHLELGMRCDILNGGRRA
jgi:hypothetical protein